jgi:hypothetical protein
MKLNTIIIKSLALILSLLFSSDLLAARNWVGGVPVQKVLHAKSNGSCAPTGGPCMIIYFEQGYKSCQSVSVGVTDHHYETLKSLTLVSMTAKKNLSLYLSDEYCGHIQLNNINNVLLQ